MDFAEYMSAGMKRMGPMQGPAQQGIIMPSPKIARTTQLAEGEGWLCKNCGNHNFETRAFCNLRKCGAPGPWTCPACNNKNFQGREVCNRKSCGMPRPGGAPAAGTPLNTQAAIQAVSMLQSSGLTNIPGMDKAVAQIAATVGFTGPAAPVARAAGAGKPIQEGSWVCLECRNINFPNRESCNAKMCGKPRSEVDGGPPQQGASGNNISMAGEWVCGACRNINWPKRDTCGMRNCQRPRHEVDAGPPSPDDQATFAAARQNIPAAAAAGAGAGAGAGGPVGSWTCLHCNNLNYPNRTVCNKRSCGMPREA